MKEPKLQYQLKQDCRHEYMENDYSLCFASSRVTPNTCHVVATTIQFRPVLYITILLDLAEVIKIQVVKVMNHLS